MSYRTALSFVLATSLATACATDENTGVASGAGGKADGNSAAISFADDWSETVSGDLTAGSPVSIRYDLDRLQDCRGSTGGSEVWGVSGYASFDGAAPVTFALSRLDGGVVKPIAADVDIPATASHVDLWFAINNRWGCIAYDSNENANYGYDIAPSTRGPVLAFEADLTESQSSALHAGAQAVVHYDPSRLAECAASSGGYAKWAVTMHYQVDGGATKSLLVTRADGPDLVPSDAPFTVPNGRDLAVWFEATSTYGCHAYDSDNGANYHFTVE